MKNFNSFESVYWVFTQLCNDKCDHCYNTSGPQGNRMNDDECLAIINNLPDQIDRIILSGGEPIAEKKQLFLILDKLKEKFEGRTQIMLQTNGDLLTEDILDTLIQKGVNRIDIASIDRYHKHAGNRIEQLISLFSSRGMSAEETSPLIDKENFVQPVLSFGFWGATEEMWLGGNWARGRAMEKDNWKKDGKHNFCSILSGAKGFLGETDLPQEISIQLWKINPCCPGTLYPMGDARIEKVSDVISRVSKSEIFQQLNQGNPYGMGESIGVSSEYGTSRAEKLQNVCLWCDEFFARHYDIKTNQAKITEGEPSNNPMIYLPVISSFS